MGSEITLASSVRSNLLSLQKTAILLNRTQQKLATGLAVNSALDDPTSFFTSSSLNNRASDLDRLQDFVGNAIQTIQAADTAISGLIKLVEAAEGTARRALEATNTTSAFTGNNTAELTSETDLSDLNTEFSGGQTITITTGTNESTTLTIDSNTTVGDIVSAINDNTLSTFGNSIDNVNGTVAVGTAGGAEVRASLSGDGRIKLEGIDEGASIQITVTNDNDDNTAQAFRTAVAALGFDDGTGSYTEGNGSGTNASYTTTNITAGSLNSDRTALAAQFNELRDQIDQLTADARYNGVNLLSGDSLTVALNESGSSSLSLTGVTFDADGLSISVSANNFQTDYDIRTALTDLDNAVDTLRYQSSRYGSNLSIVQTRQQFTVGLINVLQTGGANMVLADTNKEGANLLALQTRQQLASTTLSIASEGEQNVLRLF